jgi:NAD-dependent dihydropyrimidine dehydrogenase PreA subunit
MNVWGLKEIAKIRFNEFEEYPWHGVHPDNCTKCGACAKRCPQKIDIPNELTRTIDILKTL